jgi:endonuclease III
MPKTAPPRDRSEPKTSAARRASQLILALARAHPDATCALQYRDPFELLVATILSAQCTDQRVNEVTPSLFRRFPSAATLATAQPAELEELIRPTGFFRAKARNLIGCAQAIVRDHAGEVPSSMETLIALPGVGRKTANVVLGHAFGITEGIAVDTHVLRLSSRLGLARSTEPAEVERELMTTLPRTLWTQTSDVLIFHGRRVCAARRPACGHCPVFALCPWPDREAFAHGTATKPRGQAEHSTAPGRRSASTAGRSHPKR